MARRNDARTHAIVIGVSRYRHLPVRGQGVPNGRNVFNLFQMESPALGAFRFHQWLNTSYNNPNAPLESCRTFVSLSDKELSTLSEADSNEVKQLAKPSTSIIRKALMEWYAACSQNERDVAILYAGGHGLSLGPSENYVLLEDFAEDLLVFDYSINVERVHQGLVGPNVAKNQFFFVDACRNELSIGKQEYLGGGLGLPRYSLKNVPDDRSAPIYRSTTANDAAIGMPGEGTVFSNSLLACLNGQERKALVDSAGVSVVSNGSLRDGLLELVNKKSQPLGREIWVVCDNLSRQELLHVVNLPKTSASEDGVISENLVPIPLNETEARRATDKIKISVRHPIIYEEGENFQAPESWHRDTSIRDEQRDSWHQDEEIDGGAAGEGIEDRHYDVSERKSLVINGTTFKYAVEQKQSLIGTTGTRDWWLWSVWINSTKAGLDEIKAVIYSLHKSFPRSIRTPLSQNRAEKFMIERAGWGEFCITAEISFKRSKRLLYLRHWLRLEYPGGERSTD